MVNQALHHLPPAMQQLRHPGRQPGLFQQLEQQHARTGNLLARLEDEAVAAGDRIRQKPQRNHHREVEGGDRGHHPHRLTEAMLVNSRRDLLVVPALQQRGNSAGHFDVFNPPANLGGRFGQRLAALVGNRPGQFVESGLEPRFEPVEELRSVIRRHKPPLAKGAGRRHDGRVQLVAWRQRHLRQRPGRRWIDHRQILGSRRSVPGPVDEVPQPRGGRHAHSVTRRYLPE